jgi:ATP-dependent Zn protease
MHTRMDADVRSILESAYNDVLQLFREHRPALEALTEALFDQETLSGDAALEVLHEAGMPARVAKAS